MSCESVPSNVTINAAFLQEIKEDHHQLKELLLRLKTLTTEIQALPNHGPELIQLLEQLRDQLAFHFSLEEAYGYFEDALESAPELGPQALTLRSQHSELYVLASDLAEAALLHTAQTPAGLAALAEQFQAFEAAFTAHESAELNLILTAIEDDIGVGD